MSGKADRIIAEETGRSISQLDDLAKVSDLHEIAVAAVYDTEYEITSIEEQLLKKIRSARKDLDGAEAAINAGRRINQCGILQYVATEIDMFAARRQDAYNHLVAACRTVRALPTDG